VPFACSSFCYTPVVRGEASSDNAIRPSVRLSQPRLYMHAGCVAQLPRLSARWLPAAVRPPEMCGLRTRPRTDVDPPRVGLPSAAGISSRRPRGDNLFSTLTDFVRLARLAILLARRCAANTALAVARCLCLSVSVCHKSELCRTTIGRIERDF